MEDFKKLSLESALKCYDRFYIHAQPSEELLIGKRWLTDAEKRDGIVFLISPSHTKDLNLGDSGVSMMLRFSGKWEDVYLPYKLIDAIVDDIQSPTFVYNFPIINIYATKVNAPKTGSTVKKKGKTKVAKSKKILKVDFSQ